MNYHKKFLKSSDNTNKYKNFLTYSFNYEMNPRLKRNHFEQIPIYSDYSTFDSNNKIFNYINNSISKKIPHKNFHNNDSNPQSFNKKYKNKYLNGQQFLNNYNNSSSIEKDLDMMKIQMSCNLIKYKINQIKNKVQDLHESSKKDNKKILINNTNNNIRLINLYNSYKIKNNYNSKPTPIREIFDINKINNKNYNEDDYENNYHINHFHTIDGSNNYTYNNLKTFNKTIYDYDKPTYNSNENKKYITNKNVLKYMVLNSSKKPNISISIINNNSNNKSNLLEKKNINKINHNFNILNDKIIQSYTDKKKSLKTEPTNKIKYNSNKPINANKNNDSLSQKKDIKVRYGSYDKYFIDNNNFNENILFKNNNNSNKLLYNKNLNLKNKTKIFNNKDNLKQIQQINKMLKNKNYSIEKKNNINIIGANNNIKIEENLTEQKNNNTVILNQFLKDNNNKDIPNIQIKNNQLEINKGINNFNYFVNKKGNIVQNNYINNNFKLERKKIKNQGKRFNKPISIINNKIKQKKIKNIINDINNDNYKVNNNIQLSIKNDSNIDSNLKNNISKYSIQNNSLNLLNNNLNENINKNENKNENNKTNEESMNKKDFNNQNNQMNIIPSENKRKENLKLRNNYSKDDIFRNSIKNKEDNNNIINKTIDINKENIFDLIIQEKKEEEKLKKQKQILKKTKNIKNNNKKLNFSSARIDKKNNRIFLFNQEIKKDLDNSNNSYNNRLKLTKNIGGNINKDKKIFNTISNNNIKRILGYKEKKITPIHKELCHKFINNPQQFFTMKLNELMLKALNIKKNNFQKK